MANFVCNTNRLLEQQGISTSGRQLEFSDVNARITGPRASVSSVALIACLAVQTDLRAQPAFDFETWDQYLGGVDSSQYSSLDQVDKSNVDRLQVDWTYLTGGSNHRFNPIVIDGVMYVLANGSTLVALDAATGEEIWTRSHDGPVGSRGISYWQNEDGADRRLLYLNSGFLTAVDAGSGSTIAEFGDDGRVDLREGLDMDPGGIRPLQTDNPGRVFEDLIIMSLPASTAGYDSAPADIHAYNVLTGALEWIFHTVPRPGEFGAESWPEVARGNYGGVHNWSESTVDANLGIVYIPTGTARYDFYGGNRHGANLFGNSLLALDARTGERLWHFQTIHHDLWDYDLPAAPKLLTVRHDDRDIDAVALPTKQGYLFVFDRLTGEPLWPIEEREVPQSDVPGEQSWPTQPFPTAPPPFARLSFTADEINPHLPDADQGALRDMLATFRNEGLFTPPSLQGTIMMPGHNGGTNWGGSAVDPVSGRMYISSKAFPTTAHLMAPDDSSTDVAAPNAGPGFIPYSVPIDFMIQSNGLSAIGPPWSQITAYDLNAGAVLWQTPNGDVAQLRDQGTTGTGAHAPRSGLVVTGGGLIFVATSSDRTFRARDVDNGSILWEFSLPAAPEGVPAVYEADGRQFIALPVGGNGVFNWGLNLPEPGPGQYMVFALPQE